MNTGDVTILSRLKYFDFEVCSKQWEMIIMKCNEVSDNLTYHHTLSQYKSYLQLLNKLNFVKAALMKLMFCVDDELIAQLKKFGYVVNLSGTIKYRESLIANINKSNSIHNILRIKASEINFKVKKDGEVRELSASRMLAAISSKLGFNVDSNCTVAGYMEFCKQVNDGSRDNKR